MKRLRDWFAGSGRAAPPEPPLLPVDVTSAAFVADPAPIYAWLRDNAPLAPMAQGGWLMTRHADIVAALSNPGLGNAPSRFSVLAARGRSDNTAAAIAANIPPFLDKPEHVPVRQVVSSAFYATLGPAADWVPALAADHAARHRGGRCDLVQDIARPYVCDVMACFVGLPADIPAIKAATEGFFHLFAPISDRDVFARVNAGLAAARQFIGGALQDGPPPGSLLDALSQSGLGPEAVIDNALLVLADGVENIEAAIALGFRRIALEGAAIPEGAAMEDVVTECLRLETPGQIIPRVAREDLDLMGQRIARGVPVFLALGSANLDEAAHPQAGQFRLGRPAQALTFGLGRHSCIGAPLARLQITSLLQVLGQAGARPVDMDPLAFQPRFGHRWPVSLPITL